MQYELIEDASIFQQRMASLSAGVFAVDTEFIRVGTYRSHLGLIQIYDGNTTLLLDPFKIEQWQPLSYLFNSPQTTLIVHAGGEDVVLLRDCCDSAAVNVLDTQIAAAFLGFGLSAGLSTLCEQLLDVSICKESSRTDWLQRPLSETQLRYAAQDVFYLMPLYEKLREMLQAKGWWHWFIDECQLLNRQRLAPVLAEQAYLKIGDAWRLRPQQLAVLRALAAWRETKASAMDVPLSRVVPNASLMELSQRLPKNLYALKQAHVPPNTIKHDGEKIIGLAQSAFKLPKKDWPNPIENHRSEIYKKRYKDLKLRIAGIAEDIGLPHELLAPKKMIHSYLMWCDSGRSSESLPTLMQGWRGEVLKTKLEG